MPVKEQRFILSVCAFYMGVLMLKAFNDSAEVVPDSSVGLIMLFTGTVTLLTGLLLFKGALT